MTFSQYLERFNAFCGENPGFESILTIYLIMVVLILVGLL